VAWYDGYLETAQDGVSNWWGDKVTEVTGGEPEVVDGAGIPINGATTSNDKATGSMLAGMNWTMIGGIAGVIMLVLMVVRK